MVKSAVRRAPPHVRRWRFLDLVARAVANLESITIARSGRDLCGADHRGRVHVRRRRNRLSLLRLPSSRYSLPTKLVFAGRPLGWIVNGFFTWLHKPTNDMIDKKGYISVLDDDDIWGPQYEGVDLSADEDLFGEENAGGEENALHDGDTNSGSGKVRLLA